MASIGSSIIGTPPGGLLASTAPRITNLVLSVTPGTPASHAFVSNLKQVMVRPRQTNAKLQFAFVTGESGTKFVTIRRGTGWFENQLNLSSTTLFIQSDKASTIVEILEWS